MIGQVNTSQEVLRRLHDAWERRDAAGVAALFSDDGVYAASVGPLPGVIATGQGAICNLVENMFEMDRAVCSEILEIGLSGDRGYFTWRYTLDDGTYELGCDLITVRNGQIVLKDAYRKVRR